MKSQLLFGGKTVVFAGDFRQILPIVSFRKQEDAIALTIKRSYTWQKIQIFKLTKNLRIKGQDEEGRPFADFLLKVGEDRAEKDEEMKIAEFQQLKDGKRSFSLPRTAGDRLSADHRPFQLTINYIILKLYLNFI